MNDYLFWFAIILNVVSIVVNFMAGSMFWVAISAAAIVLLFMVKISNWIT